MAEFSLTQSAQTVQDLLDKIGTYALNEGWTTLTSAVNALLGRLGNTALTTTAQDVTSAVNELDAEIGTLSNLTTTEKGSLVGAVNEVKASVPGKWATVLWTNSSPTSSFVGQSISIDLANYNAVLIVCRMSTSTAEFTSHIVFKDNDLLYESGKFNMMMRSTSATTSAYRQVRVAVDGVTFEGGYSGTSSGNGNMIPVRIYGIK